METTLSLPLELWGGVECTVNRVHDTYYDQLERSGHRNRALEDLELFSQLGLRTLRTALHWERFAQTQSWAERDTLLEAMERLHMNPIVGLLHHGSGPRSTSLLDDAFPEKLAAYALQVARRYPHITDYTPVNEAQTTARFSALYGLWFPHDRSMVSYIRALHNQIKGVVLSMQSIRTVQPDARLIHTEDAGQTFATPQLEQYRQQREDRRWLGVDLLCGRVDGAHPLYSFLRENGLSEAELFWFQENALPPSILGLNYYVTSDRFLDHRVALYPGRSGGDTGAEPLVDVEAVRVRGEGIAGAGAVLRQAWERYHLPLAITEAHLGSSVSEQMLWLSEVWSEAQSAQRDGVDVRGVTAWALLGSYNWSQLCTRDVGDYEAGVLDLTTGVPVATPLAALVHQIATTGNYKSAGQEKPGWWHHPDRFTVEPWFETATEPPSSRHAACASL